MQRPRRRSRARVRLPSRSGAAVWALGLCAGALAGVAEPALAGAEEASRASAAAVRPAVAHLWVHPGAGGSCTRSRTPAVYRPAQACPSGADAYASANAVAAGSRILVKGGSYERFQLVGRRHSRNRIVFDVAPGERALVRDWIRIGSAGQPELAPAYLTVRRLQTAERGSGETPDNRWGVKVDRGARHIRLEGLRAGNFLVQGAQHVAVVGGEYGPCRASKVDAPVCEINKVDGWVGTRAENVVVHGVLLRNYEYAPSCAAAGDCHHRALFVNGVKNFTLRNSTIRDSVFAPWFTISGPDAAGWGNENVLIENNAFGSQVHFDRSTGARSYATAGLGLQFAWCQNARAGIVAYRNVTVRFNSFSRGSGVDFGQSYESGCTWSGVRSYGNVNGVRHWCNPQVAYRHNVYRAGGTCHPSELALGTPGFRFYAEDVHAPGVRAYMLAGPRSRADDLVPGAQGCPARDRFGTLRGRNGRCDAGLHERHR